MAHGYPVMADWFFQMVFVATAASIVSGTLAERVKLWPFLLFTLVLTAFIYPVVGAWTWGGGWFNALGFQDATPLFLYSLSAALALRGMAIQRVRIRTVAGRAEDIVDVVDRSGAPIRDVALLNQIKLSVLLTKQFAYFVGAAPDPYAALMRFEQLTEQILSLPERGRLADLLADRRVMHALALLLGSSALPVGGLHQAAIPDPAADAGTGAPRVHRSGLPRGTVGDRGGCGCQRGREGGRAQSVQGSRSVSDRSRARAAAESGGAGPRRPVDPARRMRGGHRARARYRLAAPAVRAAADGGGDRHPVGGDGAG